MGELVDALIGVAVLQGAVLSYMLAHRRDDALAQRLLAALTFAVALMLLLGYLEMRWGFGSQPHFLALAAPLPFLFGPLLYLYIVALTRPVGRFDPRWAVHALPFVIDVVFMTQQFYVLPADEKLAVARAYQAGKVSPALAVIESFETLQAISYLAASWLALQRYGRKMRGYFSDLTRIDLRWLRGMVLAHAATWSVVILELVLRTLGVELSMPEGFTRAVQLGSTLVIFLTGYMSLLQPELFQKAGDAAAAVEPSPRVEEPAVLTATERVAPEPSRPKYQRNRLDDAEADELVQRLLALMTAERPYRDGSLTLPALADALGVTPHTLSQILNTRIDKTFYAFVNSYRVAAVKEALADPAQNARAVLEIALAAGFNSKSTLNSFFKRETGLTPTEYRAQAQAQAEHSAAA